MAARRPPLRIPVLAIAERNAAPAETAPGIDRGRIIEEGRHESLIRENGLYAKLNLWRLKTFSRASGANLSARARTTHSGFGESFWNIG